MTTYFVTLGKVNVQVYLIVEGMTYDQAIRYVISKPNLLKKWLVLVEYNFSSGEAKVDEASYNEIQRKYVRDSKGFLKHLRTIPTGQGDFRSMVLELDESTVALLKHYKIWDSTDATMIKHTKDGKVTVKELVAKKLIS